MRRWNHGKVLPVLLLCLSLLFLLAAPPFLSHRLKDKRTEDPFEPEKPEWTGILTLWDIPYVSTGKGSAARWLEGPIRRFEKNYPGVFIDVRSLSTERLAMYLSGGNSNNMLPDMISLGIYEQPVPEDDFVDLLPDFKEEELDGIRDIAVERVLSGDRMIGVPWMMGSYGLAVKEEALSDEDFTSSPKALDDSSLDALVKKMSFQKTSDGKKKACYGFCSYADGSRPILSMIYGKDGKIEGNDGFPLLEHWSREEGILPPDWEQFSYSTAFRLFAVEQQAGVLLGSSKFICDNRSLQQSGKGVAMQVFPVPMEKNGKFYQDQIAAYGVLRQDSSEKQRLCTLFLRSLLEEETQKQLTDLGMFSVQKGLQLYAEDEEMKILEESLSQTAVGPFGENRDRVNAFWEKQKNREPAPAD